MSDDRIDDGSNELGKTVKKMGGIADRFDSTTMTTETRETTETIDTTDNKSTTSLSTATTDTESKSLSPGDEGFVLREEWSGRTIYLPEAVVDEIDIRYSEVNVDWQRTHGEQLPKNKRFYPALIQAGLRGTSINQELNLEE